ncbi:DNA topoisomerase 2-binding protein 1-like [Schistocerca cancellata]|uniref:DNA topoisomerase 2-binding protein 1-like n=1 Tax=Schistocerca cancellata TaxID=274614 RepID=UPI00211930EF|nr:DNA topoisomerase 2-binding protein 1-like [Schistocerca cancellata]
MIRATGVVRSTSSRKIVIYHYKIFGLRSLADVNREYLCPEELRCFCLCQTKLVKNKVPTMNETELERPPPKYMEVVNKLTLADAKEAGPFVDGCKVYLSGFTPDVCENLSGILNAGGATRLNELSDSVSHIVVGDHVPEDVNYRKKSGIRPHVVTVDWLLESMKQRHPAPESHFLVFVKPTELPLRLSRKPLSKIKGQSGETFGGINIPRKRKAEELQQKNSDSLASPPAATRVRIFSPVAGTSRDNVQPESSSQTGVKQPPKILISSMKDKRAYVKMIMDLGGIVSYKSVFDPTTTHLICSRPGWYKKTACCNLLLCIASGKWILHKSFIDASCRAGTFVEEEEYEFGNPKAEKLWGKLQPRSMQMALAKAGYRWRRKLCGGNSGPFTGMRAIVCTKQKKAVLLAQVIKAGGGEVLDIRQVFSEVCGFSKVGHLCIYCCTDNMEINQINWKSAVHHTVHAHRVDTRLGG